MTTLSRFRAGRAPLALGLAALAACSPAPRPPAGAAFAPFDDAPSMPIDAPYGLWNRPHAAAPPSAAAAQAEIEALEAIGYLDGSTAAPGASGVQRHDPARAHAGLNFFTSGHAPEAYLMDMAGTVLHTWRYEMAAVWPDYPFREGVPKTGYWRRAHLLPGGSVLAIYEGIGLIKIDRGSTLEWAQRNGAHHDLEVLPDGRIWVLTRVAHLREDVHPTRPVLEDFLTLLDADGATLQHFSLIDAFERSEFRGRMWSIMQPAGDVYHANAVEVLDDRLAAAGPAFTPGSLLVSMLYPNAIAVIDPVTETAAWMATGSWRRQHHPTALESGRILLFDNRGGHKHSRAIELEPASGAETVVYAGGPATPFYSWACGAAYRLPNGNTLVCESDRGRAFEIAPDRSIVWEFLNPHRAGPGGQYIATLFDLVRLPPEAAAWSGR